MEGFLREFGKREEGYTLLEVIAAVVFLGIILLPIYSMFVASFWTNLTGRNLTVAATLAQDEMERLKGKGYEKLRERMLGKEELTFEEEVGGYKKSVTLKILSLDEIAPGNEGEIILIDVAVSWEKGRQETPVWVKVSSFLGKGLEKNE